MRRSAPNDPILALLALALLTGACGKKLAPEPPLEVLPARVETIRLTQEGSDVVLRFPYPSRTTAGEPLTDLTRVTVYRQLALAPSAAMAPPTSPADAAAKERDEADFRRNAQRVRELSRADMDGATYGGELVIRDSLLPLYAEKRLGKVSLRYGVTATRDRRRESAISPLVGIVPKVPPKAPGSLQALVEERRVCLGWRAPKALLDGTAAGTLAFAIYRREEREEEYGEPLKVVTGAESFADEAVVPETRYAYTVRAAPSPSAPLVQGPPADEIVVDTRDVFPPPRPEGLQVLVEATGTRLVWSPVLSPDLLGYAIYREEPDGRLRLLARGLTETTYFDQSPPRREPTAAPSGRSAGYAVSAVDRKGNESARTLSNPNDGRR